MTLDTRLAHLPRRAAINVDIDALHLYYRIHGLPAPAAEDAVWDRGVPRFAELFDALGVKATFFVVARDLETHPRARDMAEALNRAGHELASHSYSHPYDLVRLHDRALAAELDQASDLLAAIRGRPVAGFRAPGYTITPRLFAALSARGYRYDSSLFPCPPYYLAKLGVLALMALSGRRSESIVGPPGVMWERRLPHRRPEGDGRLWCFPVTVLPLTRFPVIGTSLLALGDRGWDLIRGQVLAQPFVNLELHGIDLCDLALDGIDPVMRRQPDLRLPLGRKLPLLRRIFGELAQSHTVATLEQHAQEAA
jgi:hypothetical protein